MNIIEQMDGYRNYHPLYKSIGFLSLRRSQSQLLDEKARKLRKAWGIAIVTLWKKWTAHSHSSSPSLMQPRSQWWSVECAICKFCIIARYSWMTQMIRSRETRGVVGRGLAHGIAGRSTPCSSTNARMTDEKQIFFLTVLPSLFFKKRTHVLKNYHVLIFWTPQER